MNQTQAIKPKKKLKEVIGEFFFKLKSTISDWYRTSKFGAFMQKVGWFLGYVFWPFKWIKERTFDKLRFDVQKKVVSFIFLLPVMIGFVVFFLYPMIMSIIYSLGTPQLTENGVVVHFSQFYTTLDKDNQNYDNPLTTFIFYNYKYAFTVDADYPVQLLTTLGSTCSDCAVITIFSLLIAVMLNGKYKGRGLVRAIFFLPVIFNSEAVSSAMTSIASMTSQMSEEGSDALSTLFDMTVFLQGIGIPKFFITFVTGITDAIYDTISYSGIQILIFLTAIQSVPKHLYEAATIEGATAYEQFWKITLPMVSNMIPTVIVYTVVDTYLRSEINEVIDVYETNSEYGIHAAMSWSYLGMIGLFLLIVLGILSKVVFYYDDRK